MTIRDLWITVDLGRGPVQVSRMRNGRLVACWNVDGSYGVQQMATPGRYRCEGGRCAGHDAPLAVIQAFERGEFVWPVPDAGGGK